MRALGEASYNDRFEPVFEAARLTDGDDTMMPVADLRFEMHFEADLAESRHIDSFVRVLHELAPGLLEELAVCGSESDRDPIQEDWTPPGGFRAAVLEKGGARGALYDELVATSPPPRHPRRFGSAHLRSATRSNFLAIQFDQYVPAAPMGKNWLFSNSISGTFGTSRIAGHHREDLVRNIAIALGSLPGFLWGAAYLTTEFESSNLHNGPDGIWAIGRDISSHLPGIYWLNLFGATYVRHMNLPESTTDLAFAQMTPLSSGGLAVQIYERPEHWETDAGRTARHTTIAELGRQFFFDRSEPDQDTVAPDFGLPELINPGRSLSSRPTAKHSHRSPTSGKTTPADPLCIGTSRACCPMLATAPTHARRTGWVA